MNKANFKSRLIIGSANFTQNYGVDSIKVKNEEIKKILNLAKKNNINKIDTAENYLKNNFLFTNINKQFKIFSKIKPDSKWLSLEFCQKKLEDHLKSFNKNSFEIIFFHDIRILFTKNGLKIFKNLEELKKRKYFKKIGISIYDTNCLNYLIKKYHFDAVQCPYNILNKKILTTGWFERLKHHKIETHIRSVFLQGLLVNKSLYKIKYFKKWQKFFFEWFQKLDKNKISPIDYCLNDLIKHDFDKIVIGINDSNNFREIMNFKITDKNKMINFNINDTKLTDPRNWK